MKKCIYIFMVIVILSSCMDLDPKPLSFYTPENTFVNAEGLYSALTACERNMRHEYFGDGAPLITELVLSDIAVEGSTDKAGPQMDIDISLLPDANLNSTDRTKVGWYWYEGFKGVKYANVVLSRIDDATFKNEKEKNAVLGAAYFQRAFRYFNLVHQFGDVPFIEEEITAPKYDFYSYDRWSILERMRGDLEFAYEWLPKNVDRGKTSKEGCGVLLMKVYMALCDFDKAITLGKEIVKRNPLMTNRFTTNKNIENTNIMFDLHSVEAKIDMSNTEGLLYVVSYPEVEGSARIELMRNAVPFWNHGSIRTPDGQTGTSVTIHPDETDLTLDLNRMYGRGIGRLRSTSYFTENIWTDREKNDLRGIYNKDSWKTPEDLRYNNPSLKSKDNPWYGKNFIKNPSMAPEDTIRCWYPWPQYKTYVPDPLNTQCNGGETPWYVYRTAEVYLMLAECYYWKNELSSAAEALNVVRERAGADLLKAADVDIAEILAERARELYYEERRKSELTRIAYTYAKTGKPCEVFSNRVYKMENFSGPVGSKNLKEEGYNFYYDWVNLKSNFYNKGVKHKWAEYKISVHHVLWPIPSDAINTNIKGVINQNVGYPGAENNLEPIIVPPETKY